MGPLVTKILCGVLVMSLSVLFGYLPVLISRKFPFLSASDPRNNKKALRNTVFSFVLNFGGGVLFANSFCHWLPEVNEGKRMLWQSKAFKTVLIGRLCTGVTKPLATREINPHTLIKTYTFINL